MKKEIEEVEGAKNLSDNVRILIEIVHKVNKLLPDLPLELVFKTMVQAVFSKMELGRFFYRLILCKCLLDFQVVISDIP